MKNVKLKEGNAGTKQAVFTVTRKGNRSGVATVHFATADDTALAGTDYVASAGTLTFGPGVKKLKVSVPVKGNTTVEPNKVFQLGLSGATYAAIARDQATGTIVNDDKRKKTHAAKPAKAAAVRVNFQPAGATTPAGFLADTGGVFGSQAGGLSFGWDADNTADAATRAGPADRATSTFEVLHAGSNTGGHSWEIALADGQYKVHVAAGGRVDAEGKPVVTASPTAARPFAQGTRTITVSDGRLTLTAGGADDTDIASVEITRLASKARHHG